MTMRIIQDERYEYVLECNHLQLHKNVDSMPDFTTQSILVKVKGKSIHVLCVTHSFHSCNAVYFLNSLILIYFYFKTITFIEMEVDEHYQ